jgi:nitroimidazol reductase NimA-like FMN-containing flavoprotein (pyridoxamine 5'-phosphate oxidase superfamily)
VINDTYLKTIIDKATVARLATVDSECKPHLIPVVFVFDNDCYFIPIDEKTKRSKPENLKRIKNIQQNPNVALLIVVFTYIGDNIAYQHGLHFCQEVYPYRNQNKV